MKAKQETSFQASHWNTDSKILEIY